MASTSVTSNPNTVSQAKTFANTLSSTSHLTSSSRLEDQAATAALYVTHPDRNTTVTTAVYITHPDADSSNGQRYLDNDKLSSAGAAASLKYAQPKDLPSYPTAGVRDDSAAGAAASLGWANQKSFEHWKPDPSTSASKAAMLAKDYKAPTMWQPEQSASGAKAALLAAKDGGKVDIWRPEASSYGNSAANQAFKSGRSGALSPKLDYGYTKLGRQGSLMAATGAMSGVRKRSESTPVKPKQYPEEAEAGAWALSAATHANRPSTSSQAKYTPEAGAVPFVHMPREMFTSNPPVGPEMEEKNRDDVLRASAIAMAKRMYIVQQRQLDEAAKDAASSAAHRRQSTSTSSDEGAPMRYNNLQEAAQRLARERLAKLHDEHAQNRQYLDYYGNSPQRSSRLSIRGRRQRASSAGSLDDDKQQSEKIRAQMSIFSTNLSQIDEQKRQKDREALMAIAQRIVTKSLQGMDERVYAETGKASPAMMNDWEIKAHAAAQRSSETRMENYGKVDIGGGKFMNQSAVDLVAARNVQPILDEINEKAEQARVRQAELQAELDAQKRATEAQKARERDIKEVNRKLKEQDKEAARARKAEERAAKEEQKRAAKEEKRKSKEGQKAQPAIVAETGQPNETSSPDLERESTPATVERHSLDAGGRTETPIADTRASVHTPENEENNPKDSATPGYVAPQSLKTSMEMQQQERLTAISTVKDDTAPGSPGSPKGVKSWLKTRFGRRMSKGQKQDNQESKDDKAFVGGAALFSNASGTHSIDGRPVTQSNATEATHEGPGEQQQQDDEEDEEEEQREGRSKRRASSLDQNRQVDDESDNELEGQVSRGDEFEEARDHFNEDLAPPPSFAAEKPASPVRDSKFHEEM